MGVGYLTVRAKRTENPMRLVKAMAARFKAQGGVC